MGAAFISSCFLEVQTWKIASTTPSRSDLVTLQVATSDKDFFEVRTENYPLHFFLYPSSIVITFIRLEISSQTFSQLVPSTYCYYFHTPLIPLKDLTHPSKLAPKNFYLGLSLIHLIQSLYSSVHAPFPNPQPLSYVYKYCLRIPLRLQILKNQTSGATPL